jgi:hypothetical protein
MQIHKYDSLTTRSSLRLTRISLRAQHLDRQVFYRTKGKSCPRSEPWIVDQSEPFVLCQANRKSLRSETLTQICNQLVDDFRRLIIIKYAARIYTKENGTVRPGHYTTAPIVPRTSPALSGKRYREYPSVLLATDLDRVDRVRLRLYGRSQLLLLTGIHHGSSWPRSLTEILDIG